MNSKNLFATLIFLSFAQLLHGQRNDYGVTLMYNRASQTYMNPQSREEGQNLDPSIMAIGIGAFYKRFISSRISFQTDLAYQQKGFKDLASVSDEHNNENDHVLRNELRLLTLSESAIIKIVKFKKFTLNGKLGLELNTFLSANMESKSIHPIKDYWPINQYNHWKRFSLNRMIGFNIDINNKANLDIMLNRGVTPMLQTEIIKVKDQTFSFRLNLPIIPLLHWVNEDKN